MNLQSTILFNWSSSFYVVFPVMFPPVDWLDNLPVCPSSWVLSFLFDDLELIPPHILSLFPLLSVPIDEHDPLLHLFRPELRMFSVNWRHLLYRRVSFLRFQNRASGSIPPPSFPGFNFSRSTCLSLRAQFQVHRRPPFSIFP